jgi:hypothetical protein
MTDQPKVISVFGSSAPRPGSADYEAARSLGRQLAQAGLVVQTGGYSGVMAGASQGANEAGGLVIGVTCAQIERFRPMPANQWVKQELKKKTLRERLLYLVERCDGAIILTGGIGTLSEMALMWSFVQVGEIPPRPIITVGGLWQRTLAAYIDSDYITLDHQALVTPVRTVDEAVKKMVGLLEKMKP